MSIIQISELHEGRGGSAALQKNKGIRKHTRVFRVVTDNQFDTSKDVLNVLPSLGSLHPRDSAAYCTDVAVTNESFSKLVWKVTLSYSTERELNKNPLLIPAAIEWSSSATQYGFVLDAEGNPIMNSANDWFAEQVKGERSFWTVNITKNLAVVPAWVLTYPDAVNENATTIDGVSVPAKCAKVSSISISKVQTSNDISYREVKLGIKINPDTWTKKIVDQGRNYLLTNDDGSKILTQCYDKNGKHGVQLLDGEGKLLWTKLEAQGEEYEPGDEQYLEYDIYPLKDFSALPLS